MYTSMNQDLIISAVHVLFTGPFLLYVGVVQPENIYFYYVLFGLAVVIILAFLNRFFRKELYAWLFVHLFLFAALLLSVSVLKIMGKKVPPYLYSFLVAVGIAAVGYHIYKVVKHMY